MWPGGGGQEREDQVGGPGDIEGENMGRDSWNGWAFEG